jgi:hypothetical protein
MDMRASDGGDRRRGSMGKHATKEAALNGGTSIGVAPGDGEENPSWVGSHVLPAPARVWLEAGDQGGDLGVWGGAAAVGGNDDEGRPRRFIPCFSPLGYPWNRPRTPHAGSLEPATGAPRTDPWSGTLDLGSRKARILEGALDDSNQRGNMTGEGAVWVWRRGGREGDGREVGAQAAVGDNRIFCCEDFLMRGSLETEFS